MVGDSVLTCRSYVLVEESGHHLKEMWEKKSRLHSIWEDDRDERLKPSCTEGGEALLCLTDWKWRRLEK